MRSDILYGQKTGDIAKDTYLELFMHDDGKVGVKWQNNGIMDVYQDFKIKDISLYDELLATIKTELAENGCKEYDDVVQFAFDSMSSEDYHEKFIDWDISIEMRTEEEIGEYMDEAFDRVWLVRKQVLFEQMLCGQATINVNILKGCMESIDKVCEKYNIDFKEPVSDWHYGYWSGILAALRWVMGDEKDFLDT